MTLEYEQIEAGEEYVHDKYGLGVMIGVHPHDGCAFVFAVYDEDDEFPELGHWKLIVCERHDLSTIAK